MISKVLHKPSMTAESLDMADLEDGEEEEENVQAPRVQMISPETLEQALGFRIDYMNGTHLLCPQNYSMPPTLANQTGYECIYESPPIPKVCKKSVQVVFEKQPLYI